MTVADAPTCARHPEREAHVRCQRCERRVCPDCQIPAAVGVICPECFARDRRETPARVKRAQRVRAASATTVIIALCVAVYLAQFIPGLGLTQLMLHAGAYSFPENFEPWRMLTSAFAHSTGTVLHILLNMYTLWIFGRLLEPMIGTWRFVVLYLLAAWAGSVGVLWWSSPLTPVVGASGAIFGVIGAFIVIHRSLGGSSPQLYLLLGINLVIGFLPGMAIAWEAHVGGLALGALVGALYAKTRRSDQQVLQRSALIGMTIVLVLLSARFFVVG